MRTQLRAKHIGLLGGFAALLLGGIVMAGCSDDGSSGGNDNDGTGGLGGDGAGGSETGGNGTGASASGGVDAGGAGGGDVGGAGGGTGGENLGGMGGDGTGGVIVTPDAITELNSVLVTGINDLKGLTYSSATCSAGKIWGSGYTDATAGNRKVVLVRLNADGTLDNGFDADGILELDLALPGQTEESYGVVELPNCDLLVVANVSDNKGGAMIDDANVVDVEGNEAADDGARPNGQDIVLVKVKSTGAVDTNFGTEGVKKIDLGWTDADDATWPVPTYNSQATGNKFSGNGFPIDTAWDLQLDPSSTSDDPKVVLNAIGVAAKVSSGTQRTDNDRYIVRLNAKDGSIDSTFNGGKAYTFNSLGTFGDNNRRVLVEADGSIVSAGYTNFGTGLGNHVVLIRLKPDGKPDTSFDFGFAVPGVVVTNPFVDDGGVAECYGVGKQSSGRYVTTGYGRATATTNPATPSSYGWESSVSNDIVSFGILPGKLDASFGVSGTVALQSEPMQGAEGIRGAFEQGHDMVVLHDDRIVHVGNFGSRPNANNNPPAWNTPGILVAGKDGLLDEGVGEGGFFLYPNTFSDPSSSQFYKVELNAEGTRLVTSTNANAQGVLVVVLKIGDE